LSAEGTFFEPNALGCCVGRRRFVALYAENLTVKGVEERMTKHTLLTAAILISFAAPALADQYYIVRGPDRHCTVTTTKPTEQTTITQIGPLAFESRQLAEDRIKTTKVCTDDATTGSSVTIERK
jgi:hypothetical protein